jgi:hypothetical protein
LPAKCRARLANEPRGIAQDEQADYRRLRAVALRESDRSVLEALDVGVMVYGPDLALRYLNARAAACWACSAEELLAPGAPTPAFHTMDGTPLAPAVQAARSRAPVRDVLLCIGA